MSKYRLLREKVIASGMISLEQLLLPHAATDEELLRAHDYDYIQAASQGRLTENEIKRIGFPWSLQLIERSRRSSGATIEAAFSALESGAGINLAGGTHHAFREHGEGYCVFNDTVIAARTLQMAGKIRRALVIDLDVHQGNGTAAICRNDQSIYTFSMHGAKNYPLRKEISDLDIELPDGTEDTAYLDALASALERIQSEFQTEMVFYLAGSDPFLEDQLGRLRLSKDGLSERDGMVFDFCRRIGVPFVITMAGGYAKQVEDTVDIHWQTVRRALQEMGYRAKDSE